MHRERQSKLGDGKLKRWSSTGDQLEKKVPFYTKRLQNLLVTNQTSVFLFFFCLRQQSVTKPDTLCCEITEPFIEKYEETLNDAGSLL